MAVSLHLLDWAQVNDATLQEYCGEPQRFETLGEAYGHLWATYQSPLIEHPEVGGIMRQHSYYSVRRGRAPLPTEVGNPARWVTGDSQVLLPPTTATTQARGYLQREGPLDAQALLPVLERLRTLQPPDPPRPALQMVPPRPAKSLVRAAWERASGEAALALAEGHAEEFEPLWGDDAEGESPIFD